MALAHRESRSLVRGAVTIGTHRRWCSEASMKRSASGYGWPAYLRSMGPQLGCRRASISGMCTLAVPSSPGGRTQGGGGGIDPP